MTRQIIIDGQMARIEERTLVTEVPVQALAPYLTTRVATTFPVFPKGTVYASIDPESKRGLIIIEREPKRTRIAINYGDDDVSYNIQLPYQYFAYAFAFEEVHNNGESEFERFTIYNSMLFWRPTTFRTPTDEFWYAQVPNVDEAGHICWGGTYSNELTFARRIDEMTNSFTTTVFNADLGLSTPGYGEDQYHEWEEASEDPLVYLEWPFWENERANGSVIQASAIWQNNHHTTEPRRLNMSTSFVNIPPAPPQWTVGRALEWYNGLDEGQRNRLNLAIETHNA